MIPCGTTIYFGTDGIRGAYGDPHMCPGFAFRMGSALGSYLTLRNPAKPLNVIIGRDTRESGSFLLDALVCGLNAHPIDVYNGGVAPTPGVARSVLEQGADLGVVITASHNPALDNGIKIFDARGAKLSTVDELEIEALIDQVGSWPETFSNPKCFGLDISESYINYLSSLMDQDCPKRWSVVLDTANGATCRTSPPVLARWSSELCLLGNDPKTGLINDGVGSEYPQKLARTVLEKKAHIGIAHDGDGDRVVICDETGHVVDGDVLLGLLGMDAMRNGVLASDTLVATVHSNLGLDHSLAKVGGKVERVDVGDRNVAERMRAIGSNFGGESSGHIIFSDLATTGDGLLAAAKIIELMCRRGMPLSELTKEVVLFPQLTKNLPVAEKPPLESLKHLQETKSRILNKFGETGRVLIRYSGTEPKLRLLVEGADASILQIAIDELEESARMDLDLIDS